MTKLIPQAISIVPLIWVDEPLWAKIIVIFALKGPRGLKYQTYERTLVAGRTTSAKLRKHLGDYKNLEDWLSLNTNKRHLVEKDRIVFEDEDEAMLCFINFS